MIKLSHLDPSRNKQQSSFRKEKEIDALHYVL
jgi:hypothetical protein